MVFRQSRFLSRFPSFLLPFQKFFPCLSLRVRTSSPKAVALSSAILGSGCCSSFFLLNTSLEPSTRISYEHSASLRTVFGLTLGCVSDHAPCVRPIPSGPVVKRSDRNSGSGSMQNSIPMAGRTFGCNTPSYNMPRNVRSESSNPIRSSSFFTKVERRISRSDQLTRTGNLSVEPKVNVKRPKGVDGG